MTTVYSLLRQAVSLAMHDEGFDPMLGLQLVGLELHAATAPEIGMLRIASEATPTSVAECLTAVRTRMLGISGRGGSVTDGTFLRTLNEVWLATTRPA